MAEFLDLNLPEAFPVINEEDKIPTPEEAQARQVIDDQTGFGGDLARGFETTAAAGGIRRAGQEGAAQVAVDAANAQPNERGVTIRTPSISSYIKGATLGLIGQSAEESAAFDVEPYFDELTAGIPRHMWGDIIYAPSLAAAQRSRARIQADLNRERISGNQWTGTGTEIIGSFIDADMPLMFASGGMIGAAKVANTVRRATTNRFAIGAVQGLVGGTQAGAIVGAYDALVRETADETNFIHSVIGGALLGTAMGSLGGDISTASAQAYQDQLNRSILAMEADYANRLRTDDPSIVATDDVTDGPSPYFTPQGSSSAGAAQIGGNARLQQRPDIDNADGISPTSREWIDRADASNYDADFYFRAEEQTGWMDKMGASAWNSVVGSGFSSRLYTSDSAVANWMGRVVYESSNGLNRGKATASALMENYHGRIATQLMPIRTARNDWAKRTGNTALGTGRGTSDAGKLAFNREVMLERNSRMYGGKRSEDASVIRAADSLDSTATAAWAIGRGRDDQYAVDGFENVMENKHWSMQVWNGAKITQAITKGRVSRENVVATLATSYQNAGMAAKRDAAAIANAVIRRAEQNDLEIETSVHSLLQADGQDFLLQALKDTDMTGVEIDGLMKRLQGAAADRGKEGFAKARNDVDMSTRIPTEDGSELLVVDLLSNDIDNDWQRYSRRMSGAAALARQGITNRQTRNDIINAMQSEQRALGETVTPTNELSAMFTHFDGGAVKGWNALEGGDPSNAGHIAALMKRMVQLAWLNKLGLTQLGETGAMLAQNGIASWMRRGPLAALNKELKAGNKELLDELAYLRGEIGQDHHITAAHMNLDEVDDADGLDFLSRANRMASHGAYIQGFTSLFNQVRSSQQKTAALGVMDKIMRTLRDQIETGEALSTPVSKRMFSDLGLGAEELDRLTGLIKSGVIEFDPSGFVNRLNIDKWDGDLQDIVGSSVTRNINQVVQKSMAGEQDAWMHTGWGSVLSHLKTFPLQATNKQFIRHFRNNDPQAYGAVVVGFGTAAVASMVRAAVDGKEMTPEEHAKRAFGYSNMTGFLPMVYDPLMTVMGLDDYRFNQFGRHSEIMPPILSYANDAYRPPEHSLHLPQAPRTTTTWPLSERYHSRTQCYSGTCSCNSDKHLKTNHAGAAHVAPVPPLRR